jgi:hypothetical protein
LNGSTIYSESLVISTHYPDLSTPSVDRQALPLVWRVWRLAWIYDMGSEEQQPEDHHGKTSSAISGDPDIPCFLLFDEPANELLLSVGLGAGRILTSYWWIF